MFIPILIEHIFSNHIKIHYDTPVVFCLFILKSAKIITSPVINNFLNNFINDIKLNYFHYNFQYYSAHVVLRDIIFWYFLGVIKHRVGTCKDLYSRILLYKSLVPAIIKTSLGTFQYFMRRRK